MANSDDKGSKDKEQKKQWSQWETEAALDLPASLEDLINSPPFHESSDAHGHSYTAGTRLPEWMRRRIRKLIEMEGVPYDLESDVLRDAVYVGLQILNMRYKASPDIDLDVKMSKAVDQTGVTRRIKAQFDELCFGLDELHKDGDTEQAVKRLSEYVIAAASLDNVWHRDRLFRLVRENRLVKELASHCGEAVKRLILGEGNK